MAEGGGGFPGCWSGWPETSWLEVWPTAAPRYLLLEQRFGWGGDDGFR